ncbi:FtsQ-type POTRA domain-containing protein [Candidatus Dojkabacteria bacterium]|uniref:FtsQ-type POTRA domain-containing protein n=1 Tax=Candidatus Dojkabacteria bacterium TaxID=2099670 RepID=A0A847VD97_9BACT|nr:FtsQ-type POTRA domain-containing protein [Candidatus Dojkabacteria bacterium]
MTKVSFKRSVVFNKIKRNSVTIFLKKYLPYILFFTLLGFSFVFHFWDIKKIEFNLSELKYLDSNELDIYLEEYVGMNLFLVDPNEIEKVLINGNGFVKSVLTEKILPNRLKISITEYTPYYSGYSLDKCFLFSSEGTKIDILCEECEDECWEVSSEYSQIYISSNSVIESANNLIFFDEIRRIEEILSLFGYKAKEILINDGIVVFNDEDKHKFTFDIAYNLDLQLARLYLVCKKINSDSIKFKSLDLRFDRPVMKIK